MRLIFLTLLLLWSASLAHAQQPPNSGSPCPPGMIPGYGKCYTPNDPDRFYRGPEVEKPASTGPLWQDRYGAIAESTTTSAAGAAQNLRSARAAREEALRDCRSHGANDCEVRAEARNACIAAAWGGGISSYAARSDLQQAKAAVMEKCNSNGAGAACKILYSACSLPVRIR